MLIIIVLNILVVGLGGPQPDFPVTVQGTNCNVTEITEWNTIIGEKEYKKIFSVNCVVVFDMVQGETQKIIKK